MIIFLTHPVLKYYILGIPKLSFQVRKHHFYHIINFRYIQMIINIVIIQG